MKVRVFDPVAGPPDPAGGGGLPGGLEEHPGARAPPSRRRPPSPRSRVRSRRRRSVGHSRPAPAPRRDFRPIEVRGVQGPSLKVAREIDLASFPIRRSAPAEDLRQLALYVCQRVSRVAMDRPTGRFLQTGGRASVLEREILALATAFGRALRADAASR